MMQTLIRDIFQDSINVKQRSLVALEPNLIRANEALVACLQAGGKVLSCGNGGSAADSQHFSSELINRFETERHALPAIALTTDSSILTSVANDYAYEQIFARQIKALGQAGDILLAISTSGNSANVLEAIKSAQQQKMHIIALTGKDGGEIGKILRENDVELRAASDSTARIQETHLVIIHVLCAWIDRAFLD